LKKLTAIFFALLVLFNALGFYGLLVGLQYKTRLDMVQRLDNEQYKATETVTFRFPLALPYHIDKKVFERVDGEIEHHGEFYRLVKQKLERDTLYIVCIKDNDSKRIHHALTDYVKTFTDKPINAKQNAKFLGGFMKEFLPSSISISTSSTGWDHAVTFSMGNHNDFNTLSLAVVSPPPQR
jgi:hypothetical protein